jgi:hypothetical protein
MIKFRKSVSQRALPAGYVTVKYRNVIIAVWRVSSSDLIYDLLLTFPPEMTQELTAKWSEHKSWGMQCSHYLVRKLSCIPALYSLLTATEICSATSSRITTTLLN